MQIGSSKWEAWLSAGESLPRRVDPGLFLGVSLEEINLSREQRPLSRRIAELLDEAERRREAFYAEGLGLRYPKYVPSDPHVVASAMAELREGGHLRGDLFCEWGCGFGIAAGIASLLGFEAVGIEFEPDLADRAAGLLDDLGIGVEILNESYLPEGYETVEGIGGKDLIVPGDVGISGSGSAPPTYEGLDPGEVDLFFVYPYPDEEDFMRDLFEELGDEDAVLLMYQGEGEISAWRKDVC